MSEDNAINKKNEDIKQVTSSHLVFISHDTRDAEIAEEFSILLKKISAGVLKSFRSSDKKGNQGIEYGVEWYPEIIKNIQQASDVVCLLTPNSIDRPWILFEAGMAKGKLNTPILGITLGISLKNASTGPFAQFQNCGDDEQSLCKLVYQLVDRIPNSEPDDETIKIHVQKFKSNVDAIFKKRQENPEEDNVITTDDNASVRLFEEIKVMFQDLPSRIEKNINTDYRERKRRRLHPELIEEIFHISKDPKIGIVLGLGLLKDKFPWIYDIGMDTLNIMDSNINPDEKLIKFEQLERIIEFSLGHPIMREYFSDNKEDYILIREVPHVILRNFRNMI